MVWCCGSVDWMWISLDWMDGRMKHLHFITINKYNSYIWINVINHCLSGCSRLRYALRAVLLSYFHEPIYTWYLYEHISVIEWMPSEWALLWRRAPSTTLGEFSGPKLICVQWMLWILIEKCIAWEIKCTSYRPESIDRTDCATQLPGGRQLVTLYYRYSS